MKSPLALFLLLSSAVDAFVPNSKPIFASKQAETGFSRSTRLFEQSEAPAATTPAELEFSTEEQSLIESLHEKFADGAPRNVLMETLPTLSPALIYRLRQATDDANPAIKKVATELNELLDEQLKTARNTLQDLLNAGEIRKLDSIIGKAQREGRLDTAFFNVLTVNLQDAAKNDTGPTEEGAASRLQILQHIYTRCQEEVEKSIPPGLALLNKLLRTPQDSIRSNLYEHYLTPQKTKITSPDGKEIELASSGAPLVPMQDFIDAVAQTVKQIRTVETVGATDKVSAANMVESCRTIAKEARVVIGDKFGVESDELRTFEEGLLPVFRPSSAESPYITGEA